MSSLKTFTFRDANTLEPRDNVASNIIAFVDRAGAVRTQPVEGVRNLGGGLYGVMLSDADVLAGTTFLVEPEPAVVPTHASGSAYPPSNPIHAFHFENPDGSLWAGDPPPAPPLYQSAAGAPLTPPALVPLVAPYLYGLVPSASDLAAGVGYLVAGPPGSIGLYEGSFLLSGVVGAPLGVSIAAVLTADPAVSALVGTRIYPNVAPQGAALPHIVYNVISAVPESSLDGQAGDRLKAFRLQLDSYASTYLHAHQVDDALDDVVGNLSAPDLSAWRDLDRDLYDNPTQRHRVQADYIVMRGAR